MEDENTVVQATLVDVDSRLIRFQAAGYFEGDFTARELDVKNGEAVFVE